MRAAMTLAAALVAGTLCGPAGAGTLEAALARAGDRCETLGGRFSAPEGAVSEIGLGPGAEAEGEDTGLALDYAKLRCEGVRGAFCGSGGCGLRVQVGAQAWEWQVEGWSMTEIRGFRLLALVRDGGWCGGAGAQICFETLKWDGQRFLTVGPAPTPAQ